MNDFKLKVVLAMLSGIVFSFIFILLAFVVPAKEPVVVYKKPKGKLETVSHSFKNR
ncbi:hypothetical protein [Sulfurimonas sp.]